MTKILLSICLLGLLLFGLLPLFAEQVAPAAPATLSDFIVVALQQQNDILLAQESSSVALARKLQARSGLFPQLSAQYNSSLISSSNGNHNNGSLALTQTFFDGGFRDVRIQSAGQSILQADAAQQRTVQQVINSVTAAYLAVLRAQQQAAVSDGKLSYFTEQKKMIQARIDAGDAAATDIYPIDSQLANARVEQLATQNSIRNAKIQLQQAVGLTPGSPIAELVDIPVPAMLDIAATDSYVATALAQRPEMAQQRAAMAISKLAVRTAKLNKGLHPSLSGQLNQPLATGDSLGYGLTASVAIDLFDGGNNKAALAEANSNLKSSELRADQVELDITAQVNTALINLTNARERIEAAKASLIAAERNLEAQKERYLLGLSVPLDSTNAQLDLTTAQSSLLQANYDYMSALAQLHYVLGNKGEVSWEKV